MTQMLKFNGDSYIAIPDSNLDHTGDFTIEAWVKSGIPDSPAAPDATNSAFIFKKASGDSFQYGMELRQDQDSFVLNGYYGTSGKLSETIPNFPGVWRHVALAVSFSESDNRSTAVLYIDGEAREATFPQTTEGKTPGVAAELYIGKNFRGKIAEVRIWNEQRTRVRIKANMRNPLTGREPGLIARLPLDDGGAPLKEYVYKRAITTYQIAWEEETSPVMEPPDKCLNLQWEKHYAKLAAFAGFPSVRITTEFWLNTFNTADQCVFCCYRGGDYSEAFCIKKANSLTVGVCGEEIDSGLNIADGEWRHVAVSWHALTGALIIYIDGVNRYEAELARGMSIPDSGGLIFGQGAALLDSPEIQDSGPPFDGKLCDVRIWSIIRSPEEIARDMFFRLAGDEPNLAGCWRLDDGEGNGARNSCPDRPPLELIGAGVWRDSGLFLKDPPVRQVEMMREGIDSFKAAAYELRIQELLDRIEILGGGASPVKFDETLENLNKQISDARKESKEMHDYYLGDVHMELKAIPVSAGSETDSMIIFPTAAQHLNIKPDQLSSINVKFLPRHER